MTFDPDLHSLAYAVRQIGRPWTDYDVVVSTLVVEYGFDLPLDTHMDELQRLVEDDLSGKRRTWSTWKNHEDGLAAEAERHYGAELADPGTSEKGPPYKVIYADPGWQYRSKKAGGSMKSGAAQHYRVATVGEIAALPVRSLVHLEGSALFLWGTVPMLPECWTVFQAWGFNYKTMLFWIKDDVDENDLRAWEDAAEEITVDVDKGRLGMGSWFRGQIEYCMVGTKGDVRAFRCQKRNYVFAKATTHSKKPEKVRNLILEATAPLGGPRVELFSRDLVQGWDHWGDAVYTDLEIIEGAWQRRSLVRQGGG